MCVYLAIVSKTRTKHIHIPLYIYYTQNHTQHDTEKNSTTNQLRFVSCENAEKSITLLLLVAFVM